MALSGLSFVPNIARLSSRIILILGCNPGPMTLQGTNTYLLGTGRRRILLDTGDANTLQYINHLSKVLHDQVCEIEQIVVSHWHHDHIGGVPDVLKISKQDCKVWKYKQIDDEGKVIPPTIPCENLIDGQIITAEGVSLRVIHTPGHTTDHVVLLLEEDWELFSGDTILGEGTAVFEDLLDYMNSLKKIQDTKPKIIYPGHGPVIKAPEEVINYYLSHRQSREDQILSILKSSSHLVSARDIVKVLYKDIDETLVLAAENNVRKHLAKLLKENRVLQMGTNWKVINS